MKITDVKEKEVVHCQTEAEAIRICNLMHAAGMKWKSGNSYLYNTYHEVYGDRLCFLPIPGNFSDLDYYNKLGFKIIPSTEITAEDELVPAPDDLFEPENGKFYNGEFAEVTLHPFTGKVEIKKVDEDNWKITEDLQPAAPIQDSHFLYTVGGKVVTKEEYFNTRKANGENIIFVDETKAERRNEGKLQWSLVDFPSLESMVEVLGFGAEKYSADNWKKGLPVRKQIDSLLRHVTAIAAGVELDEESGLSHIGHAQCNLMFLAWTLKNKPELDDR